MLQDSTLFLYRKRVARHLQQLFWLGSHAQKFCFAGLSTILGRIPNVEKWLKKVLWPLSSMLRNFFVLISTSLAQALTILSAAALAMNICSTFFFPHAATGSRVLIPPLPICSAPQFLPSILPQLFSTSKAPTLAFTVGCCLLSATVPLCRFPFFSIFEAPRAIPFASGCCAAQRRRLACVQKLPKISTQKSMPIAPGISTRSSITVLVRKRGLHGDSEINRSVDVWSINITLWHVKQFFHTIFFPFFNS